MCKMPYGESDYRKIRENDFVYIDKTKYIELLENDKSFIHFLRPRRFGKSLFTSMLGCYYDVATESEFDLLFQDTYIHSHPTKEKNSYYILNFNFSGFTGKQGKDLEMEFNDKVYEGIQYCIQKYGFSIEVKEDVSAARIFSRFILDVQTQLKGHKIYVIIDEYDHFANDLLSFRFNEFNDVMGSNGYVRGFYEEIKNGTQMGIGRIFVTGVSPISLDSMTSGYNISTNLTLDPRYNEMMGFTSDEMKHLISMTSNITNADDTLREMKWIYDGYMFSEDGRHHVFNPNMSLYYLDRIQSFGKAPKELIDPNIFSDYKKIKNLLLIKPDMAQQQALMEIMEGKQMTTRLTLSYSISQSFSLDDFISLLFYLGYLTIKGNKRESVILVVPNEVIRIVYYDYFRSMLQERYQVDINNYIPAVNDILDHKDNTKFINCMEDTLKAMDNRDFIGMKELDIKYMAMPILRSSSYVTVKSEYAIEDGKYIDLAIFPKNTTGATALIELKHIKQKEYTDALLKEKITEATKQLQTYKQAEEFQHQDVVAWIMIFCKNKCVYQESL